MTPLEGALLGFASTVITTLGGVLIAFAPVRRRIVTIEKHTNGLLNAEKQRTDNANAEIERLGGAKAGAPSADAPESPPA